MAFVDDEMAVVRDEVRDLAVTHEALDQRDIDDAGRFAAPATDDSDVLRIDVEECLETLDPLGEQLATMDENERIARPSER